MSQPVTNFIHSGDRGDIIYGLPVLRHRAPAVLYIYPTGWTRVKMTRDQWCGLDALIGCQPYIVGVHELPAIDPALRAVNLNRFRQIMVESLKHGHNFNRSLADWQLMATNTPLEAKNTPWLTVEPTRVASVVVNRSGADRKPFEVYHNKRFPWGRVIDRYLRKDAVFIGTAAEHKEFSQMVYPIPFHPTKDLHEAAKVIAGCDLFIGNQSAPAALAEGLKKRIIMEVWPGGPNCLFFRPDVTHVWDQDTKLPDL